MCSCRNLSWSTIAIHKNVNWLIYIYTRSRKWYMIITIGTICIFGAKKTCWKAFSISEDSQILCCQVTFEFVHGIRRKLLCKKKGSQMRKVSFMLYEWRCLWRVYHAWVADTLVRSFLVVFLSTVCHYYQHVRDYTFIFTPPFWCI